MSILINTPSTNLLLTSAKIQAALGGEPILTKDIAKYAVTGIKGVGDADYVKGNYDLTAAKVGLGKVENKSAADILGELDAETVETLLNSDYDGDDVLGVSDRITALEEALGLDSDADSSIDARIKAIEDVIADKLESDDITVELIETIYETGYDADGDNDKNIAERITALEAAVSTLQGKVGSLETDNAKNKTDIAELQGDVEDIKEALGLDEEDESGTSILDRLEAVETKATTNETDIAAIEKAVGIEDGYSNQKDIVTRLGEVENLASANKTATETNAKGISDNKTAIDALKTTLGDLDLDDQTIAEVIEALQDKDTELDTAVKKVASDLSSFEEEVEETYIKSDDLDGAEIARRLGFTPESAEDEIKKYTFVKTKWYEQMNTAGNEPTGFYAYDINYSELGFEKAYEAEMDFQLAPVTDDYTKLCNSVEAGMVGGIQTATKLTILAMNEAPGDFDMYIKADFKQSGTAGEDD